MTINGTDSQSLEDEEGNCKECKHDFDAHCLFSLVADKADIYDTGGVILCPSPKCRCFHTWGPAGMPAQELLPYSEELIDQLRIQIQGEQNDGQHGKAQGTGSGLTAEDGGENSH